MTPTTVGVEFSLTRVMLIRALNLGYRFGRGTGRFGWREGLGQNRHRTYD